MREQEKFKKNPSFDFSTKLLKVNGKQAKKTEPMFSKNDVKKLFRNE